jgi:hypothetical protein
VRLTKVGGQGRRARSEPRGRAARTLTSCSTGRPISAAMASSGSTPAYVAVAKCGAMKRVTLPRAAISAPEKKRTGGGGREVGR